MAEKRQSVISSKSKLSRSSSKQVEDNLKGISNSQLVKNTLDVADLENIDNDRN